jgi:rSAM/selenodomain-associated transferase 1
MSELKGRCAIAVMAKAPRVGEVKTRLTPPLTSAQAASLGRCFIRDIADNIQKAAQSAAIDGYVAYSPPGSEDQFRGLLPDGIALLPPRHAGLGASLFDATEDLLGIGYGAACLVNADSPNLPTSRLVEAAQALLASGERIVLGPAEDGGYYLIGLKHPHRGLFENITWSTDAVFRQTLDRAAALNLETVVLAPWYDVDDVTSLRRVRDEITAAPLIGYEASHTAALLRELPDSW